MKNSVNTFLTNFILNMDLEFSKTHNVAKGYFIELFISKCKQGILPKDISYNDIEKEYLNKLIKGKGF